MALTIGTDAYVSLIDIRAYWLARDATAGPAWAALADATAEIHVRNATDYVDRNWDYIGDVATSTQRLKWPRKYAEVEGNTLSDSAIPWQIEEATSIIADLERLGTVDLRGIVTDSEAAISMQKVDVITVQYDNSRRLLGADIPTHVYKLLRPLTLGQGGLVRA